MRKAVFKRPGPALSLGFVEKDVHSAAVYGDLFFLFVVNDRKTSAPVFIREHVDPHVSPAAVQLHLCRSGQGKASGFISGPGVRQVDLFIAKLF